MVQHALITPLSPVEQVAVLASGAMDAATRQQTRKTAGITIKGPDGSKILAGGSAGPGGLSPWVGDVTPPGVPTGVSAESGAGLVLVSWDGGLKGGVPPDFDHVQILVDGADAGRLTAAGTLACGPYGLGSVHAVTAVAWDDAHGEDGGPAPNASPACAPVRVTVTGADVDPGRLGITVTKSDKEPQGRGAHTGDLWLRYTAGSGSTPALAGEWWWDGSVWVPIPVAIYLDQLAARGVQVDSAVIGLLSAGIIKSGTFATPDGLVGFDDTGFWAKNDAGAKVFKADADGISMSGVFQTDSDDHSRLVIAKRDEEGTPDPLDPAGTTVKRTTHTMDFHPARDPSKVAASIEMLDTGDVTELRLGDRVPEQPAAHLGTMILTGTGGDHERSITTQAEALYLWTTGNMAESHISILSSGAHGPMAGDVEIQATRHLRLNGNVSINGRDCTSPDRRLVEWISDWSGTPAHAEGTTKWEYETDINLRNSPTGGQWLVAELGARVIANNGEYFMTISITGGDGNEYFLYSLSSTKSPGTDNFTASKLFMLPNGAYHVRLGFTRWGSPAISGDTRFAFKDWTPGRGIKTGFRYFTLTELN